VDWPYVGHAGVESTVCVLDRSLRLGPPALMPPVFVSDLLGAEFSRFALLHLEKYHSAAADSPYNFLERPVFTSPIFCRFFLGLLMIFPIVHPTDSN
jgi:hypothetical protein